MADERGRPPAAAAPRADGGGVGSGRWGAARWRRALADGPLNALHLRITALVLAVVALVWLVAAAAVWWDARQELDSLLDEHLAQVAQLLLAQQHGVRGQDMVTPTPATGPQQGHDARVSDDDDNHHDDDRQADGRGGGAAARRDGHSGVRRQVGRDVRDTAFQLYRDGVLVVHSARAPEQPLAAGGPGLYTVAAGTAAGLGAKDGWRVLVADDTAADGARLRAVVAEELHARGEIMESVVKGMGWPLLLALPVLAVGIAWGVRRGTAPLRALGRQIAEREPGLLQPLVLPATPVELRPPVRAMNDLFARIGALLEAERRFTADAAHELRTPIAAIRAQAQVAQGAQDGADRARALQATLAGCDRATHLVEQLLVLARLEAAGGAGGTHRAAGAAGGGGGHGGHGAAAPTAESPPPVDLVGPARQVLADLAPAALARAQVLSLQADGPCPVAANAGLLAVLVRNLVDNALRYSPDGAEVQVAVQVRTEAAADTVCLQVDDGGPGLTEAQCQRLGERFFRVLGSGRDGSGLGWSIVRRIAAVQGARVQVDASPTLGGLRVQVCWPAATAGRPPR